jgi:hypothetical protein
MSLLDMLSRGYFPKELPRPFVTTGFANFITSQPTFSNAYGEMLPSKGIPLTKVAKYSQARVGLLRRQLSLPNPLSQYHLSREIFSNWQALSQNICGTALSGTIPEFKSSGRAINGMNRPGFAGDSFMCVPPLRAGVPEHHNTTSQTLQGGCCRSARAAASC